MNNKLINRYSFGKIKDRGHMPNFRIPIRFI